MGQKICPYSAVFLFGEAAQLIKIEIKKYGRAFTLN